MTARDASNGEGNPTQSEDPADGGALPRTQPEVAPKAQADASGAPPRPRPEQAPEAQAGAPDETQGGAGPALTWSSPGRLVCIGLGLGFAVEVLFYGKRPGVSFPIWAGLSVLGMLLASRLEGIRPGRIERWLPLPILFFAAMVFIRAEPLTVLLSVLSTLGLFALWVRTFRSADLLGFGWTDFLYTLVIVPLESWFRPWSVLSQAQRGTVAGRQWRASALAVLRGLLLALPVLFVFTALLSQADLVFADTVERALRWLDLERIFEYLGRGTVVLLSGLFSLGAIAVALRARHKRAGEGQELLRPFLGFTEAAVVLSTLNLILLLFVVIQVRYLFGGEANITAAGYTYSEYARRGFGELVAVAVLSLGLILSLGMVTRRAGRRVPAAFNALSAMQVLLVGVILVSALMRLLLYEQAYGFTRLRTYTHVAILWMALMFAAFLVLLLAGRLRRSALVAAVGTLGFVATLGILNVDAFIVRQNAARLAQSGDIDLRYLLQLSEDAVPELLNLLQRGRGELTADLGAELGCWRAQLIASQTAWPSLHWSRSTAARALLWEGGTKVGGSAWRTARGTWMHWIDGESRACRHQIPIER